MPLLRALLYGSVMRLDLRSHQKLGVHIRDFSLSKVESYGMCRADCSIHVWSFVVCECHG